MNSEVLEFQEEEKPKKLSDFLSVLTILTFIGSGLNIIMGIFNLATAEQQKQNLDKALEGVSSESDDLAVQFVEGSRVMIENMYTLQTVAIIVAIACIFGALQMRQLKKSGFYIYLVASLFGVAFPLFIVGMGLMGAVVLIGSVVTIAFIIMYAANLKHMS